MVQGLLLPPGVLEIGLPTVMFGRPESGKSTLAILQAVALMSGRGKIIGIDGHLEPQPVGFIWAEEGWDILECKIAMILQEYGIDPGEIEGRCFDLTTAAEIRALFIDSLSAIAPEAEMDNAAASHTANGLVEIWVPPNKGTKRDIGLVTLSNAGRGLTGLWPSRNRHRSRGLVSGGHLRAVARFGVRARGGAGCAMRMLRSGAIGTVPKGDCGRGSDPAEESIVCGEAFSDRKGARFGTPDRLS